MALPEPLNPVFVDDPHPSAHNEERTAINDLTVEVADRIPFPSGAAFGDLLRWNGLAWETTETRFLEGNGRPDGVVAAPIGSRYVDQVGAQGAVEWVKRSGGGTNVGWICLAGDTGVRDVSSLVDIGNGTLHNARLIRSGQVVELHIDVLMPSDRGPDWTLFTLPIGFRTLYNRFAGLVSNRDGADTKGTMVASDGRVQILGIVSNKRDRYSGNWITADAWPSVLPGTAL